jgi:phage-related protein
MRTLSSTAKKYSSKPLQTKPQLVMTYVHSNAMGKYNKFLKSINTAHIVQHRKYRKFLQDKNMVNTATKLPQTLELLQRKTPSIPSNQNMNQT